MERATIRVDGIVQSVGFRPFVYRTATSLDLRGRVRNRGDAGVLILLEGDAAQVDVFLDRLREDPPPLARVETVDVERERVENPAFDAFQIAESTDDVGRDRVGADDGGHDRGDDDNHGAGTIPPDTAMCDACLADVRHPDSRFYDYWATACVDCGPRFTVVESLPYDRPATSMAAFPMCEDCRSEYEEPADRRYHAQAIACPACGPELRYLTGSVSGVADREESDRGRDPFPDAFEDTISGRDAIRHAAAAIGDGDVVVLKGIGGAHLACDATSDAAVARLRERSGRPRKPFALMAPHLSSVRSLARLGDREAAALTSNRRPILLLEEDSATPLAEAIAPDLHSLGVMLPYAGVHHLLFDDLAVPMVLTSANMPGQPMLVSNWAIVDGLADVADGFLLHNRRIVARCDDSVARVVGGEPRRLRRSRGFAPTPVRVPAVDEPPTGPVLGVGPELDATAGFLVDGDCYLTQYLGDVDTVETESYYREAVEQLRRVAGIEPPTVVAHDRHPDFLTTDLAREFEREHAAVERRVPVQHHHAHAASVLAEHDRDRAISITIDGVGYGPDGTIWGGEILDARLGDFERVGGLAPMAMPGGDRATRHPGRMTAGILFRDDPTRLRTLLERHDVPFPGGDEERDLVCQQLEAGVNTPATTSAGRFLDAVSALLGVCGERSYEGEPAMTLEAVAAGGDPPEVDPPQTMVDGRPVLDAPALLATLVDLVEDGMNTADVAATAQEGLARGLAELAIEAAVGRGLSTVALSGGVAYNEHVHGRIRELVTDAGMTILGNEAVPPGDGGIAYGQVVVAAHQQWPHD